MFHDASQSFLSFVQTTADGPQFGSIVQVKRRNGSGCFCGLHAFDDYFRSCRRQRCKDSATMEPANTAGKNFVPVEITSLQQTGCFVAAVVENHGCSDAAALIAVNGGHVWSTNAIVFESFVERCYAHGSHSFIDQITQRIVNHRTDDAGVQLKAV